MVPSSLRQGAARISWGRDLSAHRPVVLSINLMFKKDYAR